MAAVFWVVGIAGSIFASFYLGKIFGNRIKFARYLGFAVTAFWLFWTLGFSSIFLGYSLAGPLATVQLIVIVTAFVISFRHLRLGRKHQKEVSELLSALKSSDNDRLRAEAEKLASGRVDVLETPAQHREIFLNTLRSARDTVIILSGWATSGPDPSDHK